MARETLSAQEPTSAGMTITMTTTASADGIDFANSGRERVLITNDTGGSITVTVKTPGVMDGDLAIAERTKAVANGAVIMIGPFKKSIYNQSDGMVDVDFSGDGAKAAVIRWPH